MNCDRTATVLQCYYDGELDPLEAATFERHLEHCLECAQTLKGLKSLSSAINSAHLYARPPASLHRKVRLSLRTPSSTVTAAARKSGAWLALAASLFLLVYTGWQASGVRRIDNHETQLGTEVVDAHLRSLQPGHLTDVLSSDQHTVKPWFNGKLDFSPPVEDFASQGFPLQGGRLDVVHGRTVAALVYGRRKHLMNVFIWPASEPDAAPRAGSSRGYRWLDWRQGAAEFCVVSDASAVDLEQLRRVLAK